MMLVTGASGFLGKAVIRTLPKKDITILSRNKEASGRLFPGHKIIEGDITDQKTLQKHSKLHIDKIVHLAGLVSYRKQDEKALFKINVEGTRNVLEAFPSAKKIVFASSVGVYGPIKEKADESHETKPGSYYGFTKLEAEQIVRESRTKSVCLRIAPIYGEGSKEWKLILGLINKGYPIPRTATRTHIVHSTDAAQAINLALNKGNGVYNIADKSPLKFTDLASKLFLLMDKKPKYMNPALFRLLASLKGMGSYVNQFVENRDYAISRAVKELGYTPKAVLEQKLKEMVESYRKEAKI